MLNAYASVASLYAREAGNLRRHLQRKLGNPAAADDVMQDAYIRMLAIPADHPTLRSPKAFLFTVANNLAVDSIRHERRSVRLFAQIPEMEIAQDGEDLHVVCPRRAVEDQVDAQLRLSSVVQALQVLPPKCRAAFILHKFNELSYAEVAERLEVTVSMVEKYLSRALQHLRQYPELFDA